MKTIVKKHDFSDFVFANLYPIFFYPVVLVLWVLVLVQVYLYLSYLLRGQYFQFFYLFLYGLSFSVIFFTFLTVLVMGVIYLFGSLRHSSRSEISYDSKSLVIKIRNSKRTYKWDEVRKCHVSGSRLFISFKDLLHFHISKKGVREKDWNELLGAMAARTPVENYYLTLVNILILTAGVLWLLLKFLSLFLMARG